MERCPSCHRFGIGYDSSIQKERCIWKNCSWVNWNNIDVSKVFHPIRFKNFINAIKKVI